MSWAMRDTSSRSSSSRDICASWRSMTSGTHRASGLEDSIAVRIAAALRIAASGLRSSWASVARNSSLRRSAACSARFASLCAVMSWSTTIAPSTSPSAPRNGTADVSSRDVAPVVAPVRKLEPGADRLAAQRPLGRPALGRDGVAVDAPAMTPRRITRGDPLGSVACASSSCSGSAAPRRRRARRPRRGGRGWPTDAPRSGEPRPRPACAG